MSYVHEPRIIMSIMKKSYESRSLYATGNVMAREEGMKM